MLEIVNTLFDLCRCPASLAAAHRCIPPHTAATAAHRRTPPHTAAAASLTNATDSIP